MDTVYAFGPFRLETSAEILFRGAAALPIGRRAVGVLRALLEHPGVPVSKDALMQAAWPGLAVEENNLTVQIAALRRVLMEEPGGERWIETLPRRGYRFVGPIIAHSEDSAVIDRLMPTAPLAALERRRDPPSALPGDRGSTSPKGRTDLGDVASDPGSVLEEVDRDLLVGERKHVTVLCADLKESLERLAEGDAEKALETLEATLTLMKQTVHRYGGTVNIVTGEGIVAVFGAPVAFEDHAVRACLAVLEIREAVQRSGHGVHDPGNPSVLVRAGLSSGEVVTRLIENGGDTHYWAIGPTAHQAARLEQIAPPGTLLVSAETLRLAEGHVQVEALATANAHSGQLVYELVGAQPPKTRFQVLASRGLTSFMGRNAELEQLERLEAKARRGHGQVVVIIGEPGLGKSRLVHEFVRCERASPSLVLETAPLSYRSAASYEPVVDLLKTYFRIAESDEVAERRNKVADRLLGLDGALALDLPALLVLLDIPVEEPSWQEFNAFQRRERILAALKRLLLREAQRQPVILVLEDLHWIDSETQAFLETLIDGLASAPVLLILTCRPEYAHPWGSKTNYTQMRLDALPPEAVDAFLRSMLGDDTSLVALKQSLQSQGNPFFLEESVRTLVETSLLEGVPGDYRLVHPMPELPIPPSVHALLAARIDRLSGRSKRLLHAASVVGKDVPHAILELIADLEEGDFRCALANLQDAEFVYEVRLFPDLEYTFKHALTHGVAYGSLLAEQRRTLHRRIVDAVERLYPDRVGEHVEQLAYHANEGELWEKAANYLRWAGTKAEARSGLLDALAWLKQALVAVRRLPENRTTLEQATEICLEVRAVLAQLGEPRQALEFLREAEILAERLNDDHRRCRVRSRMINLQVMLGEFDQAFASGERVLAFAHALGDSELYGETTNCLGMIHFFRCDHARVLELLADNARSRLANRPGMSHILYQDYSYLIMSLAELGRFAEAAECEIEMMRLAESTRHPHSIGFAHRAAATFHILKGDWEKARALIEGWLEVIRSGNVALQRPTAIASSAWVLAQLGETSKALKSLQEGEQAIQMQVASGVVVHQGSAYHCLGRACLLLGRLDEARRLADRAVESSSSQPGFAAHALNLLGDIASHPEGSDLQTSEVYYRRALALAEPRGMRPLVGHCHHGLGKLYLRTRNRPKALEHHNIAATLYREMDMIYWLDQAQAQLRSPC
jgi:class 3 adenylate cyclase/DNA-binding winged helix-turn-helix (wHTH) protein/tetratricopeptide (TPR) repeat protein